MSVAVRYKGGVLVPLHPHYAETLFKENETYLIGIDKPRSTRHHKWFFAELDNIHHNLPDHLRVAYPNPETLRMYALALSGQCEKTTVACQDEAAAIALAAQLAPVVRHSNYQFLVQDENTVTIYTVDSQAYRKMNKEQFTESARKVLDTIYQMIGWENAKTQTPESG